MEEIIERLEGLAESFMEIAKETRTDDSDISFIFFQRWELMEKAAAALKRNIPQEMELEGGGSSWWYVCSECHGAIDKQDEFCRHCGQAVKV